MESLTYISFINLSYVLLCSKINAIPVKIAYSTFCHVHLSYTKILDYIQRHTCLWCETLTSNHFVLIISTYDRIMSTLRHFPQIGFSQITLYAKGSFSWKKEVYCLTASFFKSSDCIDRILCALFERAQKREWRPS